MSNDPLNLSSQVMDCQAFLARVDLVEQWQKLLEAAGHPCAVSASPEYLQKLDTLNGKEVRVAFVMRDDQTLVAIAPIQRTAYEYKFDVYSRVLFQRKSIVTEILGSMPLVLEGSAAGHVLLEAINNVWPDSKGVLHDALDTESEWVSVLDSFITTHKGYYRYSPYGQRGWYMVNVCETFDEYMSGMSGRSRNTRRREVKKLEKVGVLEFNCHESIEDVEKFLEVAAPVSLKTWQHEAFDAQIKHDESTLSRYKYMAESGLLRSYSMSCGGEPLAFLLAYQAYGTFQPWQIGFDPAYSKYSPGTVLIFKVLEDLHNRNLPERANFGVGDSPYKRRFKNWTGSDETVLVLKNTVLNRLTSGLHFSFLQSLEAIKTLVSRKTKD